MALYSDDTADGFIHRIDHNEHYRYALPHEFDSR